MNPHKQNKVDISVRYFPPTNINSTTPQHPLTFPIIFPHE